MHRVFDAFFGREKAAWGYSSHLMLPTPALPKKWKVKIDNENILPKR
jgi:hypothetical protein